MLLVLSCAGSNHSRPPLKRDDIINVNRINAKANYKIGPGHAKMCLMSYANNKGADQPGYPRSLISTFVVRCLESMICILVLSKVSRLYLVSVAEQAGLNLIWSKIPEKTIQK